MFSALGKKSIRRAETTQCLRQAVRSYVDIELWDAEDTCEPPPHLKTSKDLTVNSADFPVCKVEKGRFISPWPQREKGLSAVLKWQMTPKNNKLIFPSLKGAKSYTSIRAVPVKKSKLFVTDKPHVTWIGHATCYFQQDGLHFITDPIFSNTCSPVEFLGPFRTIQQPIEVEDLKLDVVLLSHTHYDHLDIPSAKKIGNRALWIVPMGVKKHLRDIGITRCVELNWWEKHSLKSPAGKEVDIVFMPTKHWTSRTLFDRNTCLWGSFAVMGPRSRFFFSGDTAYCNIFKTIGKHFGPFDMSAISIGAYKPRWFLKDVHCDPEEALQIHLDLLSKQSLAIHWGTFPLSDEDSVEPALELARSRKMAGVTSDEFFTMAHGETLFFGEKPAHDFASLQPQMLEHYIKYIAGIPAEESGDELPGLITA